MAKKNVAPAAATAGAAGARNAAESLPAATPAVAAAPEGPPTKLSPAPLPPPPPGLPRTTVLLLYLALFTAGVPVWWKTTEVYRAAVPFNLLDEVRSATLPVLRVRLVLAQPLRGDVSEAAKWLEQNVNRHIDPVRDGIRVVVRGELLRSALPDGIVDDWEMEAWFGQVKLQSSNDSEQQEYRIYLLPEGRKGTAFQSDGDGKRWLKMGTGLTGWLLVSPQAADASLLIKSMQVLPKMLAAVVRGEDHATSSALVDITAAGARCSLYLLYECKRTNTDT